MTAPTLPLRYRPTDPDTSRRAAHDDAPRAGSQKARLLAALRTGDFTANELDQVLGLRLTTAGRRLPELEALGLVEPTGDERPTDTGSAGRVYRLTAAGRAVAAGGLAVAS